MRSPSLQNTVRELPSEGPREVLVTPGSDTDISARGPSVISSAGMQAKASSTKGRIAKSLVFILLKRFQNVQKYFFHNLVPGGIGMDRIACVAGVH